jgi:hypothetical protein
MSSPPVCSGSRVARSLVFCVVLCRPLIVFFLLAIVLSVLLGYTDFDYPFCIFKLYFNKHKIRFTNLASVSHNQKVLKRQMTIT